MHQLLTILTLFFINAGTAQAYSNHNILDWDEIIPVAENSLLSELEVAVAQVYQFEDEGVACGGEVISPTLVDYYTFEDYEGQISMLVKLEFLSSMAINYCAAEEGLKCEATVEVDTEDNYTLTSWSCS